MRAPAEADGLPLTQLVPGERGRVVAVRPRAQQDRLVRLSTLGLVPGAVVVVEQLRPAAILRVAETSFAIETEIAGEIYVERLGAA